MLLPSSPLLWAAVLVLATSMPFRGVAAEQIAPRARATTSPDDSVDDWGDEDDSLGFGDLALGHGEKNRKPALATSKGEADLISVGGFWRSDNAVWLNRLDSGPWSRLRQSLDLSASMDGDWWRLRAAAHGAVDLAYLRDRDSFDSATKETYESVLLIRELLATATLGSVDLSVGKQIIPTGVGTTLGTMDLINPRDQRDLAPSDLEDIRLPVWSTRLRIFGIRHSFEFTVVHAPDYGLRSSVFGPFSGTSEILKRQLVGSSLGGLLAEALIANLSGRISHKREQVSLSNQQVFASWGYTGSGADLGLHAASSLFGRGVFSVDADGFIRAISIGETPRRGSVSMVLRHPRTETLGITAAVTRGAMLLGGEVSFSPNQPIAQSEEGTGTTPGFSLVRERSFTLLASLRYTGIAETVLSIEAVRVYVPWFGGDALFDPEVSTISCGITRNFARDTISARANAVMLGFTGQYGAMGQASVQLELEDALKLTFAVNIIHQGAKERLSPFSGLSTHNRAGIKLRRDF